MKNKIGFLILISTIVVAQADLVMQEQATFGNQTNISTITIKIHGNKLRQDIITSDHAKSTAMSVIEDGNTGDSFTLTPQQKTFTKNVNRQNTKPASVVLSEPLDTGKSEKVGGYDAEIFTWSAPKQYWFGTNGVTEVLWVAKDFPDYDKIKPYFVQYEQANLSAMGNGRPKASSLPGMVVKLEMTTRMPQFVQTITTTVVSVKEEPVDPAVFEVPSDYTEWKPPAMPSHSANMTTTNK